MNIFIADLDEDAAAFGEEFAGDGEPVAEVGEIGMDAEFPGVAEGADLFGLARGVLGLAVLHVALAGADLPVGAELDAVGRVDVDRLDLALEAFLLGERVHHQQGVAQNHAVGPLHAVLVLVEFNELLELDAVEVGEKGEHLLLRSADSLVRVNLPRRTRGQGCPRSCHAQVFDDDLRMDLFLDVNGHGGDFEGRAVLFVLALPDELRVERRVARVEDFLRCFFVVGHEVAQFLGGDVGALVLVLGGEDGGGGFGFGHREIS